MRQAVEMTQAVQEARQKWEGAPFHVKAMAGAYMEPVLKALECMERMQMALLRIQEPER
jgi:hypothetical protein